MEGKFFNPDDTYLIHVHRATPLRRLQTMRETIHHVLVQPQTHC